MCLIINVMSWFNWQLFFFVLGRTYNIHEFYISSILDLMKCGIYF